MLRRIVTANSRAPAGGPVRSGGTTLPGSGLKVLVVSHHHPRQAFGGAQIAAQRHVDALAALGADVLFLARDLHPIRATPEATAFRRMPGRPDDLLWAAGTYDEFSMAQREPAARRELAELLDAFGPHVVHFHHFHGLGLDLLPCVRRNAPEALLVLTLHEFLILCHADGHMLERSTGRLCTRSTPRSCHRCFPEHGLADFVAREHFARSCLTAVDLLLAPSRFLRDRLVEWGLDPERFELVDNSGPPDRGQVRWTRGAATTFGYFGQIHRTKGLHVLLEAALLLERERPDDDWTVAVNGSAQFAPPDYVARLEDLVARLGDRVVWNGPYLPSQLPDRLANVGWVVVPSIWWENRPLVIQEAFCAGRPVIASDIGGMAELVSEPKAGELFEVGSASALAEVMGRSLQRRPRRRSRSVPKVPTGEQIGRLHLELYRSASGRRQRTA